ncbi:hypothetical protein, partial [Kitasatospora sp. NPDC059327]|uniref:hypothetical protein n=1 Tax=Kitasatospora sp. NPDC059327 TaxID=3346803 RepID=UPI0036C8ECC7
RGHEGHAAGCDVLDLGGVEVTGADQDGLLLGAAAAETGVLPAQRAGEGQPAEVAGGGVGGDVDVPVGVEFSVKFLCSDSSIPVRRRSCRPVARRGDPSGGRVDGEGLWVHQCRRSSFAGLRGALQDAILRHQVEKARYARLLGR